ncbi:hypothetical protein DFP93_1313 [Aneurinibacillus soli]|uniref:Uncharacterized protein n=1 Tax=Aneurinibacillus soli TaxID=1500254 RepID=A0A0U4WJT5_9BACL|nr:hypothetical protein [Aneurinibacillus soli]PYE57366.1 hypothetical protein DFP93_1313 [Aneurinibacillus soli]BAU28763.1 hypothetical protein CB4_02940 [Aneurinibacillus soli]
MRWKNTEKRPGFLTRFGAAILDKIIISIPFGIGAIISAFMISMRQDKRAIHDFIAGTCVIYAKK